MTLRSLTKKLSLNRGVDDVVLEEDRLLWNQERSHLCQSRIQPKKDSQLELLPPRPTALQLGAPIPVPPMCAVRFSSHPRQHYLGHIPFSLDSYGWLFVLPFRGTKALPPNHFHNSTAFDGAITLHQDSCANRMWTSMALIDFEYLPQTVDRLFIGIHLPNNFYNPDTTIPPVTRKYAASGLIELINADMVDEEKWRRSDLLWPAWELASKRAEKAEEDMFKQKPELFDLNALHSTYICERETGYLKNYLWCR